MTREELLEALTVERFGMSTWATEPKRARPPDPKDSKAPKKERKC